MSSVLSGLYTSTERYQEAMAVHEDILRLLLAREDDSDHTRASLVAKKQLEQLKLVSQRAGGWLGAFPRYSQLSHQLIHEFGDDIGWEDMRPLEDTTTFSPKAEVMPSLKATQREDRRVSPFRSRSGQRGRA